MERRKITYKLYPTPNQSARLQDLLRSHKDLWNAALEERIDAWRKAGKSISYAQQCESLTQIRGERVIASNAAIAKDATAARLQVSRSFICNTPYTR